MAKFGFGQGAGAIPAPQTPMATSPFPMPRPDSRGQPQPPAPAAGGFFGPKGSQARYDMAMELLSQAMSSAQGSSSPLLSFLAPMATAAIGARATKLHDDNRAGEVTAMTESVLGTNGLNPAAKAALDVLNNPDAPDYLKSIAKSRFDAATKPASAGRARSGGGRPSSGGTRRPRLYGAVVEFNGVKGKYDGTGKWWPLVGPDGQTEAATDPAAAAAAPADPGAPASAELTDEELDALYGLN